MDILRKVPLYIVRKGIHPRSLKRFSSVQNCVAELEEECNGTMKDKLLFPQADAASPGDNKVTIFGSGNVGMACAFSILAQRISNNICIVSQKSDEQKVIGEMLDLQHGAIFIDNATISAGTDFNVSSGSRVGIITAGLSKMKDGDRLSLAKGNVAIVKNLVTQFVKTSPCSIIIMVTNPVDVLAYFAWKASGFRKNRVLGSGTMLDSARFRFFLSQSLQVTPTSCQGLIIGEHGKSCVPVWSGVNVSGVRLRDIDPCIGNQEDPENFHDIPEKVRQAAMEVITKKGYTSWSIGLSVAAITRAILSNDNSIMPVSTYVKGFYGIDKDVFLSVPCVINANGVQAIVKQKLTDLEIELLQASAEIIYKTQSGMAH